MTGRLVNLDADPVRAANEAIGQRIAAAMAGGSGDVVTLAKIKAGA